MFGFIVLIFVFLSALDMSVNTAYANRSGTLHKPLSMLWRRVFEIDSKAEVAQWQPPSC
jgi:hypothetical protein